MAAYRLHPFVCASWVACKAALNHSSLCVCAELKAVELEAPKWLEKLQLQPEGETRALLETPFPVKKTDWQDKIKPGLQKNLGRDMVVQQVPSPLVVSECRQGACQLARCKQTCKLAS